MKKIFLLSVLASMMLIGCSDEGTVTPTDGSGSMPATFTKKVVVEKFTGEWCGFCPAAGAFYDDMHTKHGDKFIGVSIHAGSASDRYKDNPACKTMYSELLNQLRHPGLSSIGFPNVMFNRNKSSMNNQVINGYGSKEWEAKLDEELGETTPVGIAITTELTGDNMVTKVSYHLKEALPDGEYGIVAYVVENNLDGSKQVSAPAGYMHQHVLRGLLTSTGGLIVDGTKVGETVEYEIDDFDVSPYNKDELEVVVFVHKKGSSFDDREILNGQVVKVGESQSFD